MDQEAGSRCPASIDPSRSTRRSTRLATHAATTELYTALDTVRRATGARDAAAWLVIEQSVRRALPSHRDEDVRQDALLRIVLHVRDLATDDPVGARAWVHAVCRSQLVNELRARFRLRVVSLDDETKSVELAELRPPPRGLAEPVLRQLDERIVAHARGTARSAASRERRVAQARAAIRRLVLEESLPEVAVLVPAAPPLLTKWVERGRRVVLETIDAERARDPDGAELFDHVATLMRKRRADAGKPRPTRRTRVT